MPQAQKRLRRAIRTGGLERSDIKVDKKKGEADQAPSPPQQAQNAASKDEILKRFGAQRQNKKSAGGLSSRLQVTPDWERDFSRFAATIRKNGRAQPTQTYD